MEQISLICNETIQLTPITRYGKTTKGRITYGTSPYYTRSKKNKPHIFKSTYDNKSKVSETFRSTLYNETKKGTFSKELWDFIQSLRGPAASQIEGDKTPICTVKSNDQIEDIINVPSAEVIHLIYFNRSCFTYMHILGVANNTTN